MSKNAPKPSTEALDAYFASFEPIDVRPRTPSKPLPTPSRTVSRTRSGVRLCLESLGDREMLSATPFGSAADNYDSALVWTPPSSGPYQAVTTELEAHATGLIANNSNVNFGEGVTVRVSSGTNGASIVKENALIMLNDAYDILHGTAENPLGTDHMNFDFPVPLTGATAIRLKQYNPANPAQGNVWIDTANGRTTVAIPANGIIAWNPAIAINKITVINVHNQNDLHPLGLDGIDVQMYFSETPVDTGTLTTEVAALSQQVADAQAALTTAQNATPAPAAINSLPWPEGVNTSAKVLGKLNVHPGQNLYALHMSPDGSMFVTASQDRTAKIWNAQTGALIRTLTGAGSLVMDAVWSKDGQSIWMTGYDRHVRQYNVSNGSVLWDSDDMGAITSSAAMSSDGTKLFVTMGGAQPLIIDTQTKQITQMGGSGLEYVGSPQALADGTFLMHMNTEAYNSGNKAVTVNPQTASIAWQSPVIPGQLSGITITPNGQWIVAGTDTGVLTIRRRDTGALAFTLPTQNGNISGMTVSGDGNQLFVGSGSQVAAFDLRPLANNQAPVLLTTYTTGIGQSPTRMVVEGKALLYLSGDGSASRMGALDRSGLAGYVVANPALDRAQGTYNALQGLYTQRNALLQLTQTQNGEHDAIMETIARINAAPQSVEAAVLQTTNQDHRVDATLNLQAVGGSVRISSWQGVRPDLPGLERTADGSLQFTGSAATLDLSQAAHLVTNVSFKVTADTGHDVTVRFLRGDNVVGSQTVHSGATASFSDAQGITGVVVVNEEQALSAAARDFLDFFESNAGQFEAHRYAWEWWNANGYKTFPQFGGAGLAYFAQPAHSAVPDAQKWNILREAAAGRHYATLNLANIDVEGNVAQQQVAVTHGLEKTPTGLLVNAPDWHQNGDTLRRGASPGYLAVGRFDPRAVGVVRNQNQYSAITLTNTRGTANPVRVAYHVNGGDTPLSTDYYKIIGRTVILYPGAPSQVVIYLDSGDTYHDPGDVDVNHIQSASPDGLVPPEAMTIDMSVLAIRNTGPAESVGDMIMSVPATGRAVTPTAGNALLNIWNSGQAGGTVRVITNEGTSQAHEMSFSLAAQAGQSVSINFTTPSNGVLSITVVLPDGRRVVSGRTLKIQGDSDEKRVATRQADGTWKLEWKPSSYSGPTVVDGGVIDPGFTAWKQDRIAKGDTMVADPANYATAVVMYAEEQETVKKMAASQNGEEFEGVNYEGSEYGGSLDADYAPNVATMLQRAGIIGVTTPEIVTAATAVAGHSKRNIFDQALTWLPSSAIANGNFIVDGQVIMRADTAAGRIIAGAISSLLSTADATSRWTMAFMAQAMTNIPAQRFMSLIQGGNIASATATLMTQAGYGHLLTSGTLPASSIIMVTPDRDASHPYADPTSPIRLRFDIPLTLEHIQNISVYNGATLLAHSAAGMFIEIPPAAFSDISMATTFHLTLKVKSDGESQAKEIAVPAIVIDFIPPHEITAQTQNLSVLSPTDPEKGKQDAVLSQIARNFPVSSGSEWTWDIGSDYHFGKSYFAADINRIGGENGAFALGVGDEGEQGTIVKLDDTYGAMTIRYSSVTPSGETVSWYVKYLHLKLHGTDRTDASGNTIFEALNADGTLFHEWSIGNQVNGRESVGLIAGRGPKYDSNHNFLGVFDDAFSSHLHLESGIYDQKGIAHDMDTRKLLLAKVNHVTASDAGPDGSVATFGDNAEFTVTWNDTLQAWQPTDTSQKVLYFHNVQEGASGNTAAYWVAWQDGLALDQMQRVAYDSTTNAWYMWDVANNKFYENTSGIKRQWFPNQTWSYEI